MTSEADEQEINDIIFAASSDDGLELDQEKLKKKKKKKKRKSEKLKRKKSKRTGPDGYSEDGSFFGNVEEVESPAAKSSPGTRSSPGERSSPDTEAYERVGGGVSHTHSQGLLKLASTHVPNLSDMIGDDDGGAFEPDYGESSFEQRPSMMQVLKTREKARRTSVGSSDDAQMLASRPQFPESRNKSSRSLGRTSVQSMEQEKMKEIQERGAVFGPPSRFDGGSQNRSSRSLGRASAISMEHEKQREARYSSGSRSTDGDGTAHVGAHPVSGPAPVTTKRSPKPSYSPPGGSHNSRVGAVPMVGGRGQSKTGDDRVGAIPTSSRSGAGTAIAPSHDDDRVGAVAVSAPPRPTKTIDDRVGAVAVAGTGRTKGPSVAAGADSYDRENSRAQRAAETDRDAKMKSNLNRLSYLPSAEDYEQAGRRTSFTEKSRVSVMPAAESYGDGKEGEETTPPDPKGKSRGPSTASYAAADMPSKDRTGPAHFSTNETYDAHDHGTLPPGNRREAPGTLSRSSSVRPSSRETSARSLSEPQQVPAGAFFITGAGNVVSRQPGALTNPPALADHLVNENAAVRASNRTLPVQDAEPEDIEEVNEQYSGHHDLEKPQAWYCSCWFKVLFVVVVLGAVGGGVGAALSSGGGGGSGSEGGSEPAGPPPTPAPTIFADVARRDAVQTVIVDAGLTSAEDLNNSTSPQNAAWVWIVNIDRLSPTESPTLSEEAVTLEKILVRYALATFFYATNGELWLSSGNWLSGRQDECNWEYLTCGDNGRVIAFETPEGAGTNIAGNIPSEIKVLTTLESILLGNNGITGIHNDLSSLTALRTLELRQNSLRGPFPSFILELTGLESIDLHLSDISGTLPSGISRLTNLKLLDLGTNKFSGNVEGYFSRMSVLQALDLSRNSFSGDFYSVLGDATEIFHLLLEQNKFSGNLTGIERLPRLVQITLSSNKMEGTIPTEIGVLPLLGNIQFGGNRLTGTIPTELARLPLELLYLDANRLIGAVPAELCNKDSLVEIRVDCQVTCGCRACGPPCRL